MRNIILLFYFITITSCHKKPETIIAQNVEVEKTEMTDKEFIEKLIRVDFFKYAESAVNIQQIDSLNVYDENTNKFAQIDEEELAEFSIDNFVPQLTKMLAKRKIAFVIKKTGNTEKLNEISINGENIILYTKEELENGNFWNSATVNFFNKLNRIMEENKSNERFYLVNEGNDLSTFLLTNSQIEIFQARYETDTKEIPRNP